MSSACVCYKDEWCFYCEMYLPLEQKYEHAEHALRQIIDESSCKGENCSFGDKCYAVIAKKALK